MTSVRVGWHSATGPWIEYETVAVAEAVDVAEARGLEVDWSSTVDVRPGVCRAPVVGLTDKGIEALRDDANAAGDELQGSICNSALRGDANHRRACLVAVIGALSQV